jgi:hypothetical protein
LDRVRTRWLNEWVGRAFGFVPFYPRTFEQVLVSAEREMGGAVPRVKSKRKMIGRAAALGITVVFTVLILSGCQSTGVVPMDQDSYFIGKKDGSPGIGISLSNKAAVYREADDFCRKKGLEVKTLNVTVTPAMPARLGSTELQFRCVPPGSEAQPVAKDAD